MNHALYLISELHKTRGSENHVPEIQNSVKLSKVSCSKRTAILKVTVENKWLPSVLIASIRLQFSL